MEQTTVGFPGTNEKITPSGIVHAFYQFLIAVRYRKSILLTAFTAAVLLGGLYYVTATRYYAATAMLVVLQSDSQDWTPSMAQSDQLQRTLMSNHQNILRSARVVQAAIERVGPELRVDVGNEPRHRWPAIIQDNLSTSVLYNTNILRVSYKSRDPKLAVTVLNAIVDSYVDFIDKTYKGAAAEILEILTKEKTNVEQQLAQKEEELLRLRQEVADLGTTDGENILHPIVRRAIDLGSELTKIQTQRLSLEVTLRQIEHAVEAGQDISQYISGLSQLLGEDLLRYQLGLNTHDAYLQARLQQSLIEDQAQLKTLVEDRGYGWAHPEVVALQEKIRRTQEFLNSYPALLQARTARIRNSQLGPAVIEMVRQKLAELQGVEAVLAEQFQAAQQEATELGGRLARIEILEHDVQWLRNLRDSLLQRITDIDLEQQGRDVRAFVIADPEVPRHPVSPNLLFTLLASVFGGLFVGLAAVYIVDVLDDRFRSIDELQSLTGVPVLATVHELESLEGDGIRKLQMFVAPNSAESEAFRTLRTAIEFADQDANVLVVTSAEPGDGKTTVIANLAVAFAYRGKRTLLIDADMRRPGLTQLLDMKGTDGLSTVIQSADELLEAVSRCVRPSGMPGLDVLPAGPRPINPAELLATPRFAELVAWAEANYDQVLIDGPPILAASDTAIIARIAGNVFIVMQPAKNRRRAINQVLRNLSLLKIPVLGFVCNRIDVKKEGYYGYEYYGYQYSYDDDSHDEFNNDRTGDTVTKDSGAMIVPKRAA